MTRFIFCYMMTDDAEAVASTVGAHVAYWKDAKPDGYLGGPFADRSGGVITFLAADRDIAAGLVGLDPFVREGVVRDWWVREWLASGEGIEPVAVKAAEGGS
jgi:uncharacterized protein YciI